MESLIPRCALFLALLLAGCPEPTPGSSDDDDATGDDDDATAGAEAEVLPGPTVSCDAPVEGFDRFTEEGVARGLDFNLAYQSGPKPCFEVLGAVVSSDLDGDGDPDLLLHNRDGFPGLFENDGGQFRPTPVNLPVRPTWDRSVLSFAAVDLTGDALPDVVVTGADLLLMSPNLGGLQFGPWQVLWDDPAYPRACFNTQVWGDIDRDGDLDVVLPAIDPVPTADSLLDFENIGEDQVAGVSTEVLLLNDGGTFAAPIDLHQGTDGSDGLSIVGFMTDRDADGDTDLYIASDRPAPENPPSAFFRNDGPGTGGPTLVNDAASIGADLRINGMGLGSNDLNGDGLLDYCMSDVSPKLACLLSDGTGGYYEAGAALGLVSAWASDVDPVTGDPNDMSTWSLELVDLENDGRLDVAVAAGGLVGQPMPDVLWQGQADGTFVERTDDVGLGTLVEHFGMVADDFDGDGHRDLLFSGWQVQPTFWSNPCSSNGWIELKLEGPPGNTAGLGARVETDLGDRVDLQEIHALRSLGQSSPSVHVGLGDAPATGEVVIHWPDGLVTRIDSLEANRVVRVRHPDAP